jgi:HSP20 family protein
MSAREVNWKGKKDMAFELWDPVREAVSLRDAMNSLLQESFVRPGSAHGQSNSFALPVDVAENDNEFVVKASLAGIKPENVQITVQGDALSIRAEAKADEEQKGDRWHLRERRSGLFQRSLSLGTPVDSEKANADFEHGVLTLRLPKSEASKPRQIKIGGRDTARVGQGNGSK